jgi:hypothetical protein
MLPISLNDPLNEHLQRVRRLHQQDLAQGYGAVHLPYTLARKYPNAERSWVWQFVFPCNRRCHDSRTEQINRYHLHESGVQKALKHAQARH